MGRKTDPSLKTDDATRLTVTIPSAIKDDARRICVDTHENLSELIARLITEEKARREA